MSEPKKLQVYGKFGSGLKTVNGIGPDENGNVEIKIPDGSTSGGINADLAQNDETAPDYVKNRTHHVERLFEPITWDGNTEGRDTIDASIPLGSDPGTIIMYKISDQVLTSDMLAKATVTNMITGGNTVSGSLNVDRTFEAYGVYAASASLTHDMGKNAIGSFKMMFVSTALVGDFMDTLGVVIFSAGTYCVQLSNLPHYTELSGDVYHNLDGRYLQNGMPYELPPLFDIQWDGNMDGRLTLDMSLLGYDAGVYFVKVSDEVIPLNRLVGSSLYTNYSLNYKHEVSEIDTETYPGMITIDNAITIVYSVEEVSAALGLPDGFIENGTYFLSQTSETETFYVLRFTGLERIVKMDSKFLANDVVMYDDMMEYVRNNTLTTTALNSTLTSYAKTSDVDAKISKAIAGAIGGSY